MGAAMCGEQTEESDLDKQIQNQINRGNREQKNKIKILLLGAGESGKSTVAKQFRLIHEDNFTDDERNFYLGIVHSNVYSSIRSILVAGATMLDIEFADEKLAGYAEAFIEEEVEWEGSLTKSMAKMIDALWKSDECQNMYARRAEYQLTDSADFYLNDVMRLAKSDYVPTDDDILRSRVKTTGVIETTFKLEHTDFSLVDVGGQRSERRKWMSVFKDVTTVIFCASLSGYNLTLYEDNVTNRMQESLLLFEETVNSKWFIGKPFILFLNKHDLFLKKVKEGIPLTICFPKYKDGLNADKMIQYITNQYADVLTSEKTLYVHVTTATDTSNIDAVWTAVRGIVLEEAMKLSGLIV